MQRPLKANRQKTRAAVEQRLTKVLFMRLPLIVAGFYVAIVFLLFLFAVVTYDDFGYRLIPVLYITYPLSLFLERQNLFVAIAAGCVANAVILYALMKVVSLKASKGAQ
jgi:hypothetical protein